MKIDCDFCGGRGWNPPERADSHATPCGFCRGAGFATLAAISRRIGEDNETVKRLIRWRYRGNRTPRKETSMRIFEKLAALAWPS